MKKVIGVFFFVLLAAAGCVESVDLGSHDDPPRAGSVNLVSHHDDPSWSVFAPKILYPPGCLVDRATSRCMLEGRVIEKRSDGAQLFWIDSPPNTAGSSFWIAPDDPYKLVVVYLPTKKK